MAESARQGCPDGASARRCAVSECVTAGTIDVVVAVSGSVTPVKVSVCPRHRDLVHWWNELAINEQRAFIDGHHARVNIGELRRALGAEPFALLSSDQAPSRRVINTPVLDGFHQWLSRLAAGTGRRSMGDGETQKESEE